MEVPRCMQIFDWNWKLSELALMLHFGQKYFVVLKITILNAGKGNVMNEQTERRLHFQALLIIRM